MQATEKLLKFHNLNTNFSIKYNNRRHELDDTDDNIYIITIVYC